MTTISCVLFVATLPLSSSFAFGLSPAPAQSKWRRRTDKIQRSKPLRPLSATLSHAEFETVELDYTLYRPESSGKAPIPHQQQQSTAPSHSIVFLHGLLGNKRNFATIATALSQSLDAKQYQIYSVDLRNHGSQRNWCRPQQQKPQDMSYPAMAADVMDFLTRHGLVDTDNNSQPRKHVTLVGHSMGGKVAQACALLYPNLIQGLVVLDMAPVAYSPQQDAHWKAVCDIVDLLSTTASNTLIATKRDLDHALRPGIPDPALRAFCLTNWDERKGGWKVHLEAIAAQLDTLAQFDLSQWPRDANTMETQKQLQQDESLQYSGDTLLIHGGQSRFVRSAYLPQIAKYFPNHMITTIRGAGHWLHAEKPEDVISILQQYLNR